MYDKFNEPGKAVAFLIAGLTKDFPGTEIEILFSRRGHAQRFTCPVRKSEPVLEKLCSRFPKASVEYDPNHHSGIVGVIQCHGETNMKHSTQWQRRSDDTRPRVLVRVPKTNSGAVLLGRLAPPKPQGNAIIQK